MSFCFPNTHVERTLFLGYSHGSWKLGLIGGMFRGLWWADIARDVIKQGMQFVKDVVALSKYSAIL